MIDWLAYPAVGSAIAGVLIWGCRRAIRWYQHQDTLRKEFQEQLSEQMTQVIRLCTELNSTCPRGAEHAARLRQIEIDIQEIKHALFGHIPKDLPYCICDTVIPHESGHPE